MRLPSGYTLTRPRIVDGRQTWDGIHIAWWRQALDYCRGIARALSERT